MEVDLNKAYATICGMTKRRSSQAKARPVSVGFYPGELAFIRTRADAVGSVSRYLRLLAEYDRKHNLISKILEARLQEAAKR